MPLSNFTLSGLSLRYVPCTNKTCAGLSPCVFATSSAYELRVHVSCYKLTNSDNLLDIAELLANRIYRRDHVPNSNLW